MTTYTLKEFLQLAGMSRQRFHERWTKRGLGPTQIQVTKGKGHRILIDAASADAFLASRFLHNVRQEQRKHQTPTRRRTFTTGVENHVIQY